MSKKLDRAAYEPSWKEVILGAILSVILGGALGAALLMLKPAIAAKELPKEPVPGAVYYLEGSRETGRARQALAKRKAFAEGQSVIVTEDEINSLIASAQSAAKAPAPKQGDGKAGETEPASDGLLTPGTPNVRIREGVMQIAMPITVGLIDQRVIVQARGGFEKDDDVFEFEPDTVYIGSCPVQRLPFVSGFVERKILAAQPVPEDIANSWSKLANVEVEGNTLKLTMP